MTRQLLIDTGAELRRRPPAGRPTVDQLQHRNARRTRRRASLSAAVVAAVGIGGIATVARRAADPAPATEASNAIASGSATIPSSQAAVPQDFGWPPRLLIDGDWEITYFNQNEPGQDATIGGGLTFTSTAPPATTPSESPTSTRPGTVPPVPAGTAPTGPQVEVMWSSEDRADAWSTAPSSTPDQPGGWEPLTVAGHEAVAFKTEAPIWVVIVAVPEGSIELRIPADDRAELATIVAAIRPVDNATFAAALPDTVVAPAERDAVIADMLADVPVPADFDPATAAGDLHGYSDRTVLATTVASQVACAWLDDWFTVWETSDAADLETILAALESAPSWPILEGITPQQSGLPATLGELVGTLRDGGAVQTGAGPAPISRDGVANTLECDWSTTQQ